MIAPTRTAPTRSPRFEPDALRIGILAPPWVPVPPPAYGGTESVLDRLARGLHDAGHDVRLWTTGESTCPVRRGFTFRSARTDAMGNSAIELRHTLEGYEWLADERCDVVHDHTLVGPFLPLAGPPVITTNHGPFDQPDLATVYRRMPPSVPIIAISHGQATVAARAGIRVDHTIHHGIDVAEVPEGDGLGDDRGPYLLFLGRLNPDKGIVQAIEAARATGSRLLIAARVREPFELAFYEHVVAPCCVDGIEYVGEVGGRDKEQLLGGAAALLSPIQWPEPFGLVMIEALAAGTPVISGRHGAAPEIVRHGTTGFLCDDHDSFVTAIHQIDSIDRHECRADVARRFGVDRMVARHIEAYRALVARHRSPSGRSADQLSLI
jgi:glycosyltransferase involved in cell wall biosynthesis